MLRPELVALFFVHLLFRAKATTQYRIDSFDGWRPIDPCNTESLAENSLIICVPSPRIRVNNGIHSHRSAVPIYENREEQRKSQPALYVPATNQPSSFATARQEISNREAEYTVYPRYSYNYGVLDGSTGDTKSAWEERDGDSVRGEYAVLEPDGSLRTVTYTADDKNGFKAVITRTKPSSRVKESRLSTLLPGRDKLAGRSPSFFVYR